MKKIIQPVHQLQVKDYSSYRLLNCSRELYLKLSPGAQRALGLYLTFCAKDGTGIVASDEVMARYLDVTIDHFRRFMKAELYAMDILIYQGRKYIQGRMYNEVLALQIPGATPLYPKQQGNVTPIMTKQKGVIQEQEDILQGIFENETQAVPVASGQSGPLNAIVEMSPARQLLPAPPAQIVEMSPVLGEPASQDYRQWEAREVGKLYQEIKIRIFQKEKKMDLYQQYAPIGITMDDLEHIRRTSPVDMRLTSHPAFLGWMEGIKATCEQIPDQAIARQALLQGCKRMGLRDEEAIELFKLEMEDKREN